MWLHETQLSRENRDFSCTFSNLNNSMVAYFCIHLSDHYVDLSNLYVDVPDIYVDLSDHYVDLSEKYHHN